jgi:hypothetical protein
MSHILIEYPQVPKGVALKIETTNDAYEAVYELGVALDEIKQRRPLYRALRYFGFIRG